MLCAGFLASPLVLAVFCLLSAGFLVSPLVLAVFCWSAGVFFWSAGFLVPWFSFGSRRFLVLGFSPGSFCLVFVLGCCALLVGFIIKHMGTCMKFIDLYSSAQETED